MRVGLPRLASLAFLVGFTGCVLPWQREPVAFVPIVDRAGSAAAVLAGRDLFRKARGPTDADRAQPKIRIEVRLLQAPASGMEGIGLDLSTPATVLGGGEADKLVERVLSLRRASLLLAPKLTVYSRQRANFQAVSNFNYVTSYERLPGSREGGRDGEPQIGNCPVGVVLDVQAAAAPEGVTLTWLDARHARLLELCAGEASRSAGGETFALHFQETVVVVGRSTLPAPCNVRLKPGDAAVVPLGERFVEVQRSDVRRLLAQGSAQLVRDGTARLLARAGERGYPLKQDDRIIAVVTAAVVAE